MTPIPTVGDAVVLWQQLLQATWVGLVSDPDTPPMTGATLEMVDGQAVIVTDVLIGPKGDPGENARMISLHWPAPDSPDDLPTDWGEELENHGFMIGGLVYVWDGVDDWHAAIPGPQGVPGATPSITFTYETIPMVERTPEVIAAGDQVIPSGTSLNPHIHVRALSPQGPVGPSPDVEDLDNYDGTPGKSAGKVLTVLNSGDWGPSDFAAHPSRFYTIPEQAFTNFSGIAARAQILSYTLPIQDDDCVVRVSGHFKAIGVELDTDPLTIGTEVRLGDPLSGQLIGRGHGTILGWSQVNPHFSEPSAPTVAATPDNGIGLIPAGVAGVITVALVNDGLIGAYLFNKTGAQLDVMLIPQSVG